MDRIMSKIKFLLVAASCLLTTGVFAGAQWVSIGMGGGGGIHNPVISPVNPDIMAVSCDMGGWYLTIDGGKSWKMSDLNSHGYFTLFGYKDPNIIYVGSDNVYKTKDLGKNWEKLINKDTLGTDHPIAMAIDPDNNNRIYVALGMRKVLSVNVFKRLIMSVDGGKTWGSVGSGLPEGKRVSSIIIDRNTPMNNRAVFAGFSEGVYKSVDSGKNFTDVSGNLPRERCYLKGGSSRDTKETILYVMIEEDGIYKSIDGGDNWNRLEGIDVNRKRNGNIAYTPFDVSLFNPQNIYVMVYDAIYKSTDGGATWSATMDSSNTRDGWKGELQDFYGPFPGRGIGVSPSDPDRVMFTDDSRAIKSINGGVSWQQVYTESKGDKLYGSTGLEVTNVHRVIVDPKNEDIIYIAYTDQGLWKSTDRGNSWGLLDLSISRNVYALEIDPDDSEILYAGVGSPNDIPIQLQDTDPGKGTGAFLISKNSGASWTKSGKGFPNSPVMDLLVDPGSSLDSRTIYAATIGGGVYKTVNGGNDWIAVNNGLDKENFCAFRIVRAKDNTLYLAVTMDKKKTKGALYKSKDAGASWQKLKMDSLNRFMDVAVHPANSDEIYVCGFPPGGEPGVYRSSDGGENWKKILDKRFVFQLTVDKRQPDLIYAAICHDDDFPKEKGACVSIDKGDTWKMIEGIPFRNINKVFISPQDINRLYLATFGGGVLTK